MTDVVRNGLLYRDAGLWVGSMRFEKADESFRYHNVTIS